MLEIPFKLSYPLKYVCMSNQGNQGSSRNQKNLSNDKYQTENINTQNKEQETTKKARTKKQKQMHRPVTSGNGDKSSKY